jgi:hypothetical protein
MADFNLAFQVNYTSFNGSFNGNKTTLLSELVQSNGLQLRHGKDNVALTYDILEHMSNQRLITDHQFVINVKQNDATVPTSLFFIFHKIGFGCAIIRGKESSLQCLLYYSALM